MIEEGIKRMKIGVTQFSVIVDTSHFHRSQVNLGFLKGSEIYNDVDAGF
jgi:hypothetical protein